MSRSILRSYCLALGALMLPGTGEAQPRGGLGAPCEAGQFSFGGFLLVCSDAGTFRYALPEDVPPAPEGGHLRRPDWYPRLADVLPAVDPPACSITGRVTFTSPMVRLEDLLLTVPQGVMVGDHVTPIDHGYVGVRPLAKPRASRTEADYVPIAAPADGEVIEISLLGSPTSIRIVLAHGCETYSVFMVVNRLSGALAHLEDELMAERRLAPHIRLLAGEEFGRQRDNPVDFSVHDGATWLSGFAAPFSYTSGETWKPYTVDPWPYFTPDLAAAYEASMQRLVPPRWGRIDQDIPGTAAGNWFLSGTMGYSGRSVDDFRSGVPLQGGTPAGKLTYAWSHLAIARHDVQPGRWIYSSGWWTDGRGDPGQRLLEVAAGQPEPSQLTAASGVVVYRLWRWMNSPAPVNDSPPPAGFDLVPVNAVGFVAVQVNRDDSLTIELLLGSQSASSFTGFTSARRTYRR